MLKESQKVGSELERAIDLAEEYCAKEYGQARNELDAMRTLVVAIEKYLDARKWYNPLFANKQQYEEFAMCEKSLRLAIACVRSS